MNLQTSFALAYLFQLSVSLNSSLPFESNSIQDELIIQLIEEIKNYDFNTVEGILKSKQIDVNSYHKGKPIIAYACINNKPEMIRLLYIHGSNLSLRCENGLTLEEHSKLSNSINDLAELIVIKS